VHVCARPQGLPRLLFLFSEQTSRLGNMSLLQVLHAVSESMRAVYALEGLFP
jgi:hypothetical protein